jgi:hypothetical protein
MKVQPDPSTPLEGCAILDELAFGPSIIEKLVSKLLRSWPDLEEAPLARVNGIMKILVGKPASPALRELIDEPAMLHMGMEYYRDRTCDVRGKPARDRPRSVLKLAKEAALKVLRTKEPSTVARLAEKFSGVYYRKQANSPYKNIKFPDTWIYRATQHDALVETAEDEAIEKIRAILRPFGVLFEDD